MRFRRWRINYNAPELQNTPFSLYASQGVNHYALWAPTVTGIGKDPKLALNNQTGITFTATGPNDFIDYRTFNLVTGNLSHVSLGQRAWNIVIQAPDVLNFLTINTTEQSNQTPVPGQLRLQQNVTVLGGVFNVSFKGAFYDNLFLSNTPFAYYYLDVQGDFYQNVA